MVTFTEEIFNGKGKSAVKGAVKGKSDKSNCRPISILSNYSKVYEKLIYNQLLYQYFKNILFPSQCEFRKGYSTHQYILVLMEKFKEAIDTGNKFGALLTNL